MSSRYTKVDPATVARADRASVQQVAGELGWDVNNTGKALRAAGYETMRDGSHDKHDVTFVVGVKKLAAA